MHIYAYIYIYYCREKVSIPFDKPYIFLKGIGGRHQTTVTFDGHDQTDSSATFSSFADNVVVQGITFKVNTHQPRLSLCKQIIYFFYFFIGKK